MGKKKKVDARLTMVRVECPCTLNHNDTLTINHTLIFSDTEDGWGWTGYELGDVYVKKARK